MRCLPATRLGAARQESDTSAAMRRALSTEYKALLLEIVKGDGPGIGEAVRGLATIWKPSVNSGQLSSRSHSSPRSAPSPSLPHWKPPTKSAMPITGRYHCDTRMHVDMPNLWNKGVFLVCASAFQGGIEP